MNKQNLDLLGLDENATKEDITAAYESLKAKYMEERFLEGEAGNNAARMLTKIETAYNDLLSELAEQENGPEAGSGAAFDKVEELIRKDDISGAQAELDKFNERGAQWHYLQSVVFYRKNWVNESKKQLEIAVQLDPENAKYKDTLRRLSDRMNAETAKQQQQQQQQENPQQQQQQGAYNGQNMNQQPADDQMGGSMCSSCLEMCYCSMCLNCLCAGCR